MRRPANILYWLEDRPPAAVAWLSGAQHVAILAVFIVYPLVVVREARADEAAQVAMLGMSMLALAVTTLLMAWRGAFGGGVLAPATFHAQFVGPALLAAQMGGMPLVAGMVLFAGAVEALLAWTQSRLRAIFTLELAGIVVTLVGMSIGALGFRMLLGALPAPHLVPAHYAIAGLTLAVMVGLAVWGGTRLRLFCALIGLAAGSVAGGVVGLVDADALARVMAVPLFGLPHLSHGGWAFELDLALPFAVAALASSARGIGTLTTCQQMNDADWVRPDRPALRRGLLAGAAGTITAGLFGTMSAGPSPSSVAMASATGVTSRRVAIPIAVIFAACALVPRVAAALTLMPAAVAGAALLFASCFVLVSGLQILASRLLDTRRTFIVGLSLAVALAFETISGQLAGMPPLVRAVVASPLVAGLLTALLLTAVFRLGQRRVRRLSIDPAHLDREALVTFLEESGASWGARRDVIERAKFNLLQAAEMLVDLVPAGQTVDVAASFDELRVDVTMSYAGPPIALTETRPTADRIIDEPDGHRLLAGYLLRQSADRVSVSERGGRTTIAFRFDH
jgi:NCS2 family nucleobase:cation symporter-2